MGWWERAAAAVVPEDNPSAQIYGTITVGTLLAAESTESETFLRAGGSVALAMVLVWLAHAYVAAAGDRASGQGRASHPHHLIRTLIHDLNVLRGACIPLLVLIICGATGSSTRTAVMAGLMASAVLVVTFELVAGLVHPRTMTKGEIAFQILVSAAIGVGVLLLKVVVHH